MTTDLAGRIAAWIRAKQQRLLEVASQLQLPTTYEYDVPVVHFESHTASTGSHERRQASIARHLTAGYRLLEAAQPLLDSEAVDISKAIGHDFGERVKFFQPMGAGLLARHVAESDELGDLADRQPFVFTLHLLFDVLTHYVAKLEDLAGDDELLRHRLASELLEFAAAESWAVLVSLPISGLDVTDLPLEVEGVRVRHLEPDEAAHVLGIGGTRQRDQFDGGRFGMMSRLVHSQERHVLEIRSLLPKTVQPVDGSLWKRVVLAFHLRGYRLGGTPMAYVWPELDWFNFGVFGSPTTLTPEQSREPKALDADALGGVVALALAIDDGAVEDPVKAPHVALHRFALGTGRVSSTDALIDFVVALEGLLLPASGDNRELRYRFALNGAVYLGTTATERHEARRRLLELYDARSRLVHGGGAPPPRDKVTELAEVGYQHACAGLLRALADGWPTQDDFLNMLLGDLN